MHLNFLPDLCDNIFLTCNYDHKGEYNLISLILSPKPLSIHLAMEPSNLMDMDLHLTFFMWWSKTEKNEM